MKFFVYFFSYNLSIKKIDDPVGAGDILWELTAPRRGLHFISLKFFLKFLYFCHGYDSYSIHLYTHNIPNAVP
jgi:hypothetical protein